MISLQLAAALFRLSGFSSFQLHELTSSHLCSALNVRDRNNETVSHRCTLQNNLFRYFSRKHWGQTVYFSLVLSRLQKPQVCYPKYAVFSGLQKEQQPCMLCKKALPVSVVTKKQLLLLRDDNKTGCGKWESTKRNPKLKAGVIRITLSKHRGRCCSFNVSELRQTRI